MAYDSGKLSLLTQTLLGKGKMFFYQDTGGETVATYEGAGFFTNAGDYGADTGDRILIFDKPNSRVLQGRFTTVQDTGATQGTVTLDTGPDIPG